MKKKIKKPRMSSVDRSIGSGEITPTYGKSAYSYGQFNTDMNAQALTGFYPVKKRKKKK